MKSDEGTNEQSVEGKGEKGDNEEHNKTEEEVCCDRKSKRA